MIGKDTSCKTLCSSMSAERLLSRMKEGIADGNALDATIHMEELISRKDYLSIREGIINAEMDGLLKPNTPTALMMGRSILDDRSAALMLKDIGEALINGKSFTEKYLPKDEPVYCSGPEQMKRAMETASKAAKKAKSVEGLIKALTCSPEVRGLQ